MPKKRKVVKRIVIDIFEMSDEFGSPLESVQTAVEYIEGLYDYDVREEPVKED